MNGRVATVLGVGPGLGAAVARRFAGESFAVAMMARREESLAEIKQDIEGDGGTALSVSADATDADSVVAAFERVRTELGDPEVLVYNAGAFQMGGILEISPNEFDECFKGEEVSDGPHRDNRGGVAHTATPLGPQAEVELPGYRAPALRFAPVLCCRVFLMYAPSALP